MTDEEANLNEIFLYIHPPVVVISNKDETQYQMVSLCIV